MANPFYSLIKNPVDLLLYLKGRTHAYHLSNLFFRDFHYALLAFGETKGVKVSYGKAEELACLVIADLERSGILKPIKPGSWMLNYPEFRKEPVKQAAAPKPAPAATAPKAPTATMAAVPSDVTPTA
jgi:hypothetical protein